MQMPKHLVIVESPTKARTLKRFLGPEYAVDSSVGHIRDLPASAAEIPASLKKEPWARLGVDVERDFKPLYVVQSGKKKKIQELKSLLKGVESVLLATDEDREGEAISWHLLEVLNPRVPVRRMVFHEITRTAVRKSLDETREVNQNLVNAQEARRIIDRLYGYEVSPLLWRKIAPRLSAGRVQSVAIRMLVEREEERMRFCSASYWDLLADLEAAGGKGFQARLAALDGKRIAGGKDFDPQTGRLLDGRRDQAVLLEKEEAERLATALIGSTFRVLSAEEKPYTQAPPPPFTTSTLQQEGGRKLRFDAKRTMRAAQKLYESGYISYMRTDSVALSDEAISAARSSVEELYGKSYLPDSPRFYKGKAKNTQEAHEAIRPAGSSWSTPEQLRGAVGPDELRVYELIWKRAMACQMQNARGRRLTVKIGADAGGRECVFQANGTAIDFPGFLRAYVEGSDDPEAALADRETILPEMKGGDFLRLRPPVKPEGHETQPPPRLTEASLVKMLEESGIGRPSTYASIIGTIERREYTFKKGQALVPTYTAFAVVNLMRIHFDRLIDYEFTARMEDRLDSIARGESQSLPYLKEFYFGNGDPGLRRLLDRNSDAIDPREACTIPIRRTDPDGPPIAVRVGRYGPYLQRNDSTDVTAPVPDGTCPDEMTYELALEMLAKAAEGPQSLGDHPDTGQPVYVKAGRFGPYVQLGDAEPGSRAKPKMVSLLPGMTPETVSLEQAVQLLTLPRVLGADSDGNEVVAHYGRYGAYIKRGSDTRSLAPEDHVLTVTLERALELLAQEKTGRGFRSAAEPLKTFPKVDAWEGKDLRILTGRFGPYVTDGEINASLPRAIQDPTTLGEDEAVRLLRERREKLAEGGGRTGRKAGRTTSRKAAKKTAKKTTKKKAAKKAGKKASKKTAKEAQEGSEG